MFLLDTNVISELRKIKAGNAAREVERWERTVNAPDLLLSVITIQELEVGVLRVERRDPRQSSVLREWMETHVLQAFHNRILPVTLAVARRSAQLHRQRSHQALDALIAATAYVHGMTVVTRNVDDFADTGVRVVNPWDAA